MSTENTDSGLGAVRRESPNRSAYGRIDVGEVLGEANLEVTGYSYDDEDPTVELSGMVDGVIVTLALPMDEAEALAEDLQDAVRHALEVEHE